MDKERAGLLGVVGMTNVNQKIRDAVSYIDMKTMILIDFGYSSKFSIGPMMLLYGELNEE